MTDSIIERQAIRAALALAVASAHGQVADAIADLRDEAAQLIGLCIGGGSTPDSIRQWCDGAIALVERQSVDGYIPRRSALSASAAILRLRLVAVRSPVQPATTASVADGDATADAEKKKIARSTARQVVKLEGNQKTVMGCIESHPDIRTKDLVDALKGTLSPRTIKRCLKELCNAGLLHRTKQDDRSVLYRVDS